MAGPALCINLHKSCLLVLSTQEHPKRHRQSLSQVWRRSHKSREESPSKRVLRRSSNLERSERHGDLTPYLLDTCFRATNKQHF